MIDYKKAEQAQKLLEESGVDYVCAYVSENNNMIGSTQGKVSKTICCVIAIMQNIGEAIRKKHGDIAAAVTLQDMLAKALEMIYRVDKKECN